MFFSSTLLVKMSEKIVVWEKVKKACGLTNGSSSSSSTRTAQTEPTIDADTAKEIDKKFGYLSEHSRPTSGPLGIS